MSKQKFSYQSQQFAGRVIVDPDIKKRVIRMNAPALYRHFLDNTCKEGDEITLNITNKRPKRSLAQNNYLHLYLSLIATSSGHSVAELKVWVKGKFLSKGITEIFGDKTRIVRDTRELNVSEFIELLMRIEEATQIPLPNTEPFNKALTHEEYDKLKEDQRRVYSKLTANLKD